MRSLRKDPKHWTRTLFLKHADLFLPWMVEGKATAPGVADGLQKIFEKHELHEGGRVLDLACGIGRISINLAKRGYYVVGTDLSPSYLQHAEKWAHKEGLTHQVQFYRMDSSDAARQFRRREQKKFDAIINIGTAMGYYGDEDDLQTFTSLRAITNPHAILVIHTVNRDYLIKHFQPYSISRIGDIEWHEIRKLNTETSSMENIWRFYTKKRGSLQLGLEIPISHRVYSLHELKRLVESAGWKYLESFGSLRELSPLTSDSIQMTVVSQKR